MQCTLVPSRSTWCHIDSHCTCAVASPESAPSGVGCGMGQEARYALLLKWSSRDRGGGVLNLSSGLGGGGNRGPEVGLQGRHSHQLEIVQH